MDGCSNIKVYIFHLYFISTAGKVSSVYHLQTLKLFSNSFLYLIKLTASVVLSISIIVENIQSVSMFSIKTSTILIQWDFMKDFSIKNLN